MDESPCFANSTVLRFVTRLMIIAERNWMSFAEGYAATISCVGYENVFRSDEADVGCAPSHLSFLIIRLSISDGYVMANDREELLFSSVVSELIVHGLETVDQSLSVVASLNLMIESQLHWKVSFHVLGYFGT